MRRFEAAKIIEIVALAQPDAYGTATTLYAMREMAIPATDRAYRIGQHKNVFVHKFVASGTLEERIDQLIEDKKRLSSTIIGSDESWLTELDNDTFKQLIALQRSAVLE